MFRYFDIHTHHRSIESDVIVVENILLSRDITPLPCGYFSVGIHPANAHQATSATFAELETLANHPLCVAVGECGIDKRVPDIERQTEILAAQVAIAIKLQKPIIIHCVRAESEILKVIKHVDTPVIFHSYAKYGAQIAAYQNILFSLSNKTLSHPDIVKIPLSKIVLETDDQQISIKEVYRNYCSLTGFDIEEVGQKIEQNIKPILTII